VPKTSNKSGSVGGAKGIFSSAGMTDVGSVRFENQDRFYTSKDHRILVVADGMGGHKGGSVAAELLINAFADEVENKVPAYSNR
jgi:serine/threonine protein phosphatase PrpC